MDIEITKMSSKGQIVIPQNTRKEINANEGTMFAVTAQKDTIILKKIETPSRKMLMRELREIAKEGRKRLEKKGIKESDIQRIIEKRRMK